MLALYKAFAGAGLELTQRPEPNPGESDVKIRVLRTGLCGTDLHIESWDPWAASTINAPMIPGHEFYGEVVEIGSRVRDVKVGARVLAKGTSSVAHAEIVEQDDVICAFALLALA